MALVSPGVQVNVIDESFYTPAEPGTVPMIFVATAQDKTNGSGTGVAAGTTAANAGKPYLLTSQRELAETFGDPIFQVDANNNPVHGGELNEYGLQAAYSLLGVSNRVYVTRADIDLGVLDPQSDAPSSAPANGTNWLDTQVTSWGIFEWNSAPVTTTGGQSFTVKTPIVITDSTKLVGNSASGAPKASVGAVGDYAVRATNNVVKVYYKNSAGTWTEVGDSAWKGSWAVHTGSASNPTLGGATTMTVTVDGTGVPVTEAADLQTTVDNAQAALNAQGAKAAVVDGKFALYATTAEAINITDGDGLLGKLGLTAATYYAPNLQISAHTSVPEYKSTDSNPRPTGSVWIKTTEPNLGARWRYKRYNSDTQLFEAVEAPLYSSKAQALYQMDRSGGGLNLIAGETFVLTNSTLASPTEAEFTIYSRAVSGATAITGQAITASSFTNGTTYSVDIAESDAGKTILQPTNEAGTETDPITVSFTATGAASDADDFAGAINSAGFENIVASVDSNNRITITHTQGGDIEFTNITNSAMAAAGFTEFDANDPSTTAHLYNYNSVLTASNWQRPTYTASDDAPASLAEDGQLWYSSVVDEVDIMVHNGTTWVGYQTAYASTNATGPIISATEPTKQTDGSTNLVDNDLWIDTSDIENYPTIYKYNATLGRWILVDTTDQTTEEGVLFADARAGTNGGTATTAPSGTIVELLTNDFLDPDAPDPALYPKGMLLWNLRRSGFNVKRFEKTYVDVNGDNERYNDESMDAYYPHRWVTESPNNADGSGRFGRAAQRSVVVKSLQAMLNSNDDIRDDESRIFNVMACPGYPELIGEMISLNYDRGLSAFIVGDSPFRLTPDATSLNEWGQNVRTAVEDNDEGLVSFDEYMGVYYPAGFTSDNFGNNVVVPPSHMALRTIALSDQVSYPWFAPAGTRRGGVTNATATGYINAEGEFVSVALNEGQRDTLYSNAINPITFLNGSGLVVFGQKTRARNASALDRINVARLVIYMRSQLNKLAKPYLFEPNDKVTRDEIKAAAESLCLELVGQRALYDYLVVCDESNNTPARIDRNELYLDIAIEPVKAVEFIYIPLRLKNTGEIAGL
jgi:hypothetical protein